RFIGQAESIEPTPSPALGGTGSARARDGRGPSYKTLGVPIAVALVAVGASLIALNVSGLRERLLTSVGARPNVSPPKIDSIAVLPLDNLSSDPQQEYLADGMTEALIADLGQISALRVISRTSVMRYKGTKKSLPEIAGELNVDAVAEGSVVREGNRVRITAQLIEAKTDRHLWAHSYDRDLTSVLALQGEVAQAIADEIRIRVTPEEHERLARARPVNPEAHELYLRGSYSLSRVQVPSDAHRATIDYFLQAIEKDPSYALAYA